MLTTDYHRDEFFATEAGYMEYMNANVTPWLKNTVKQGEYYGRDNIRLRYYYACREDAQADMVISHGFAEFFAKYHELAFYFYQAGYNVFFIEHRGFGHSERFCDNPCMAYVDDFDDYVADLHGFVRDVVGGRQGIKAIEWGRTEHNKPIFLFGHSMGGCIGALIAEKYPRDFDGVILSSPMLSLSWGGTPEPVMWAVLTAETLTGGLYTYMPGQHDYEVGSRDFDNSSGQSRKRYDYFMAVKDRDPDCRISGASYAWGRAAIKAMERAIRTAKLIKAPTIMITAGQDNMVTPEGQKAFIKCNPKIKHINYAASKHEIYNSTDDIRMDYIRRVLDFYGSLL
ncbi:MAG: alpha/beta hydrolase [Lachnospiraceae bacterium]|nr:alpha/beta hydrolase [Lachnospiraceae bacterium]